MDSSSRYSAAVPVDSLKMSDAITAFEACWITPFWAPAAVQGDTPFQKSEFSKYLDAIGTDSRPAPPYRHSKQALESKHRVIRDIFIRLNVSNSSNVDKKFLALQAVRISNDLYGNDIASSNELAKGYTRPVSPSSPIKLPASIAEAHDELIAKRKLNAILRSKATVDKHIQVGDVVQVYRKMENAKRGSWSESKPVLSYDPKSQTVTVAGSKGKYVKAAIEDVRIAVSDSIDVAVAIQEAIDQYDDLIAAAVQEDISDGKEHFEETIQKRAPAEHDDVDHDGFDTSQHSIVQSTQEQGMTDDQIPETNRAAILDQLTYVPPAQSTFDPENPSGYDASNSNPSTCSNGNQRTGSHGTVGTRELMSLTPVNNDEPQMLTRSQKANEIELSPGNAVSMLEQEMMQMYKDRFRTKEFLLHQAQGLPTAVTLNAYEAERKKFMKECKKVHVSKVPATANVISSHVLYKIKDLDDGFLQCKARIAPHGNKDKNKENLKTDSSSCPPLGFRILLSVCSLMHWFASKVDIKSAFLQSGPAQRDVYVIPPRECKERSFYWLLMVASYGLVNASAKWQDHSDTTFLTIGLNAVRYIPQLFYMKKNGVMCLIVAKVVDDILIGGSLEARKWFISRLKKYYKLGTITHMPGTFHFFGLLISQDKDGKLTISAEEKLQGITPHQLSRVRRKDVSDTLNAVEAHSFASVNGMIGFLGQNVSPLASFFNSYLQQCRSHTTIHHLIKQQNLVKKLKHFGTTSTFRALEKGTFDISVVIFADAGRPSDHGQLAYIAGLLIGDLKQGSIFHTVGWRSHLSMRPTKSSGSEETLAAGEAIDDGKIIAATYNLLLGEGIPLLIGVDCKDLFNCIYTCHTPTDKSIWADVSLIRHKFVTHKVNIAIWIPGSVNPADVLTKLDSRICDTLQLMLFDGTMAVDLSAPVMQHSEQFLG